VVRALANEVLAKVRDLATQKDEEHALVNVVLAETMDLLKQKDMDTGTIQRIACYTELRWSTGQHSMIFQ
jgi:hypothetical protein